MEITTPLLILTSCLVVIPPSYGALEDESLFQISLKLGSALEGPNFVEGDDIYFMCDVPSNPNINILSIDWFKNDTYNLNQDVLNGVLLSGKDLVLQRLRRTSSGNYTCVVNSDQGTATSNIVTINVQYSPACKFSEPEKILVKEGQSLRLKCNVDALPNTNMRYTWYFNNSIDTREIIQSTVYDLTEISYINISFTTEENYGMYSCWATNNIGSQDKPCRFNVQKSNTASELNNFLELVGRRDACDQYDSLATKAKNISIEVQELTDISQKVIHLLMKTWLDTVMWKDSVFEKAGLLHRVTVNTSVVRPMDRPHPLYELNTNITARDQFTFEIAMVLKKRANIGVRLMWVPEDGSPYSWADDDILYSALFGWVSHNRFWVKEKQVVLNTRQDGSWGEGRVTYDQWPNFQIGQKFKLQITTSGKSPNKCFNLRLYMGHERFHLVPAKPTFDYVFCLPPYAQKFLSDPRHLKLVINEDIPYDLAGGYDIYEVMYMPKVLHFSPGQI